jgi:hypothetical protein
VKQRKVKIAQRRRGRQSPGRVAFWAFLATCPPPLRALALRVHRQRPPCLLCGDGYHALGIFLPCQPQTWGIAEGWQGGCVYGLCRGCVALPEREQAVEAALWRTRQQAAARWN